MVMLDWLWYGKKNIKKNIAVFFKTKNCSNDDSFIE